MDNKEIKITGRFIKRAELKEDWDEDIEDPEEFIEELEDNGIKADIFTFIQRLPESKPKFKYYMEWDSVAAIPIKSYEYWKKKQVAQNSRKKIGLAKRKGVEVKLCDFNDDFIKGILDLYNETPIVQGKLNRQYHADFETAKKLNSTFLDRATFIGAFFNGELIAYIKIVPTKGYMRTMGILGKVAHRDKGSMNLLIAKAVEICVEEKTPYLVYGKFNYGKRGAESLKDFKRNLGFESIIVPRYYIPLTAWGSLMIKLNLHNNIIDLLPEKFIRMVLQLRDNWYARKYSGAAKPQRQKVTG